MRLGGMFSKLRFKRRSLKGISKTSNNKTFLEISPLCLHEQLNLTPSVPAAGTEEMKSISTPSKNLLRFSNASKNVVCLENKITNLNIFTAIEAVSCFELRQYIKSD